MEIKKSKSGRRILITVLAGYLGIGTYFVVAGYFTLLRQMEEEALTHLQGIANSIAVQINGDTHAWLMKNYMFKDDIKSTEQDSIYANLHLLLKKNHDANMLKTPVYTLVYDSVAMHFAFGVTSAQQPYFKHQYKKFPQQLKTLFQQGGTLPNYQDEYGHWLSAFAPVKCSTGKVVAVVQVDQKFNEFIARARNIALVNLFITAIVILVVLAVLLFYLRRILDKESRSRAELEFALEKNERLSEQLAANVDQLASVNQLRKEMIANISHDLRTPLTNMFGYIEYLRFNKEKITLDERKKYFEIVSSEGERIKKMINELFELSKFESGTYPLNRERFSVAELLQDIAQKYELICGERNIQLILQFHHSNPLVLGDIELLSRVFYNLLDNALKYNQDGGFIKIAVEKNDEKTRVTISNTGVTIPANDLPFIFDRYFKTGSERGSTGLGLAIVKKISDLHEAEITASSDHGITAFSLIF